MKKRTIFLLVTAFLAMVVGGVGSIFFYGQNDQFLENNKQNYHVKNSDALKEMHLTLSGDVSYTIASADRKDISLWPMNNHKENLKVNEEKDQIAVDVNGQQTKKQPNLFFFFGISSDSGTITIPSSVKKLVISGNLNTNINLENIELTELVVDAKQASIYLSNISTNRLSVKTSASSISATNKTQAKQASFVTKSGAIYLSDFFFDQVKTKSNSGDLRIDGGHGTVEGTTNSGGITVDDLKGVGKFTSKNGDFTLNTPSIPKDLDVELEQGQIQIYGNEIFHNIELKGQSELGTVSLLGKDRTSYKVGKGTNHFRLTSKYGDITVDGPGSNDE